MMKLYVFADRCLVPQLRVYLYRYFSNFCTDHGTPPYYNAIIYAFDNLPTTSHMLTLLVKLHCAYYTEDSDTKENGELELRQDLPQEFFVRAMIQFSRFRDKAKAEELIQCACHRNFEPMDREGCDTCNPLPEVKEKVSEEDSPEPDAAVTDGHDQAN